LGPDIFIGSKEGRMIHLFALHVIGRIDAKMISIKFNEKCPKLRE
jgi:hypothetical protein